MLPPIFITQSENGIGWLLARYPMPSDRSVNFMALAARKKDNDLKAANYYENHTNIEYFSTGLRRTFWQRSYFSASTAFERCWVRSEIEGEQPTSIYDEQPGLLGFGHNTYFGSQQELNLNLADALIYPPKE
ncbi:MAG: hypothetical protein R2825_28025 [Saprospiraceae bacterium]